jgi:hypothetical protein
MERNHLQLGMEQAKDRNNLLAVIGSLWAAIALLNRDLEKQKAEAQPRDKVAAAKRDCAGARGSKKGYRDEISLRPSPRKWFKFTTKLQTLGCVVMYELQ